MNIKILTNIYEKLLNMYLLCVMRGMLYVYVWCMSMNYEEDDD